MSMNDMGPDHYRMGEVCVRRTRLRVRRGVSWNCVVRVTRRLSVLGVVVGIINGGLVCRDNNG